MDKLIRVLIVDDSAYIRKVMKKMLSRSPFIEVVGAACDGEEALELVEKLNPDVVTLDLVMPRIDGIAFLRQQIPKKLVRVIVVSISSESSERVLEALDLGAIDFVHKPTSLATDKLLEINDELLTKVKSAANVDLKNVQPQNISKLTSSPPQKIYFNNKKVDIVVLGISTGGPQALRFLVPQLPANFPVPMAIVLHMPIGYTRMYAEKLDEISTLKVQEAEEGQELCAGTVFLAPAGRHLKVIPGSQGIPVTHLDFTPSNTLHRPAVDVLFQSASEVYKNRVLGVVMTGMGCDGKQGSAWIKSQGGSILTEAQQSCVVYGMPSSVDEAGLSDRSAPLDQLCRCILEMI